MSQGSHIDADRTAPDGDISLGRELRRAREVRGISVQQIAQETKINERYIHALENDRLDLLPGQPYTSNFVRAIARCIGADEEELIDYLNYHLRLQQPERRDDGRQGGGSRSRNGGLPLVLIIGAILVVVALTIALRGNSDDEAPSERSGRDARQAATAPAPARATASPTVPAIVTSGDLPSGPDAAPTPAPGTSPTGGPPPVLAGMSAPAPATVSAPATAPAATAPAPTVSAPAPATASVAPSAPAPASAAAPAPTVRLVWRARGWIEADQQGEPYVRMHDAGDEATWTLDRPLTLQIGNSGKVDMYIDGQPAKALGSDNETRRLSLDSRNWRSYLR